MHDSLIGKKLLILGGYLSEIEIVNAAKEMGIYTITTDNHDNWDDAPAKKVSDEAWDISWSDMESLEQKCKENHVDGIMAGFSERRVGYALELSMRLGKPFYAENANTQKIFDKLMFKAACVEAEVRVPKRYDFEQGVDFPVIVKPSDNAGSRGISICRSDEELKKAYEKALSFSDRGEVVIEEYLSSDEIMVYFTVHNGEATLSAMCDRYMYRFAPDITQLPVGYYYPSKYLSVFINNNLEKYKRLIHLLGIKDGLIAFQAFVDGNDVIPFDPTYRLDGTMAYHMIEKINGINVLKMLIHKSLTGTMDNDERINNFENPWFPTPSFELPILLGKGTISRVEGMEKIKAMKDVVFVYTNHCLGQSMERIADFSQIFCRIHLCAPTIDKLKIDIQEIYQSICIEDENGKDMIIGKNTFKVGA